jgi:hypothetical protein
LPKTKRQFVDFSGVNLGTPYSLAVVDTLFTIPVIAIAPP